MEPIILIHGGAADSEISDSRKALKYAGHKKAVEAGYKILAEGGSSLDAVEAAVVLMEDNEVFNAGYGSVLNVDEEVEMDASIMVGADLRSGAVTVVKNVAHPISLARLVMEQTPHLCLAGNGAMKFAMQQGVEILEDGSLVTKHAKQDLKEFKIRKHSTTNTNPENKCGAGTVGAVALDQNGNLAAATSTGGLTGKMTGRVSDSSGIGSGTYADDNLAAVSSTGHGESIARYCLAHSIVKEMEYRNKSAQTATQDCLEKLTQKLHNTAGAITLSKTGDVGIYHTTKRMSWAYRKCNQLHYGIDKNEDIIDII